MRLFLKRALLAIAVICVFPLILMNWIAQLIFSKEWQYKAFGWGGEIVSLCPTIIGNYIRKAHNWALCTNVSPDAHFVMGSILSHREVTIHKGCIIGPYTTISYADVGENVIFGANISVISGKYGHGRPEQRAGSEEVDEQHEVIKIGSNTWIGTGAIILANIGENCTVGAGSVVLKDVADGSTVMGNPARKVNIG